MFIRMDHAAVCVSDMERSIAFYRDVLGFERVFDRTFSDKMANILGVPAADARIVHMRLGTDMVELFDYRTPAAISREPAPQWAQGITHIGLRVQDFRTTYKALLGRGVRFMGEPAEIRPGVWVAYFYGPDGEVLEMREIS